VRISERFRDSSNRAAKDSDIYFLCLITGKRAAELLRHMGPVISGGFVA
jgi:hypothetical protein